MIHRVTWSKIFFTYQTGALVLTVRASALSKCCYERWGITLSLFLSGKKLQFRSCSLSAATIQKLRLYAIRDFFCGAQLKIGAILLLCEQWTKKHGAETGHVDMIWWPFKNNNLTFVQVYSPERSELDPFYCSCFHMIEYWDQRSKCWLSSPTDPNTNQANDSQASVTEFWGIRGVMHSCFNTRHVLFLHSRAVLCLSNLTGLHGIKYLSGAFWKMYQISVSNWCIPVADLKIW